MKTSNIIGGSNIYPCKGKPLSDQQFVNQIEDSGYIEEINNKIQSGLISVQLSEKQNRILKTGMRCVNAKHDPCWGYINGEGIRCKCIEEGCPQLKICNPTYTPEQRVYWTMTEEAESMYGWPNKQRKYYLVDLVSDEEMARYYSDSKGVSTEFPPIPNPEPKCFEKIKPKGKRLRIIGYEDTYFGDADNQLSPIWGYVDDSESSGPIVSQHYGRTREYVRADTHKTGNQKSKKVVNKNSVKPVEVKKIFKQPLTDLSSGDKKIQCERYIKNEIEKGTSYQLAEMSEKLINELSYGKILTIILSNEAEMAYVSAMFLRVNVAHDIELCDGKERVCLWSAQSKRIKFSSDNVLVSSAFVKQGCSIDTETVWAGLENVSEVNELVVSERDFFCFDGFNNQKRWGCRNLYGATHIVVPKEDLALSMELKEEKEILFVKKDIRDYLILDKSNTELLGETTEELWIALENLKKADEIPEFPMLIEGLVLAKSNRGYEIKGIGHMKFDEY